MFALLVALPFQLSAPINKQDSQAQATEPTAKVQQTEKPRKAERPVKPKKVKRAKPPVSKPSVPKPVVAVQHPVGCENYKALVSKYDWNVNVALNVMHAESGCNPSAVGDTTLTYVENGVTYGMSCGLFQVRNLPGRPNCEQMKIPEANIAMAYQLYAGGGWQHWTVCNKGIVNCY